VFENSAGVDCKGCVLVNLTKSESGIESRAALKLRARPRTGIVLEQSANAV